jgi:hypothetical protein
VRLGGIGEQRCELKGESWGRKREHRMPLQLVGAGLRPPSQPARAAGGAACTWGAKRPISPAAHERLQLAANESQHAINAFVGPLDSILRPKVAPAAMQHRL